MMRHVVLHSRLMAATVLATILLSGVAHAEQLLTLETGAKHVVKISRDDGKFTLDVDDGKLKFSFSDKNEAASVTSKSARRAAELLFKAIEGQVLRDGKDIDIGLLEEAYQLAPDDARVSYWYARSLSVSKRGNAARKIFESHREAITAKYPGRIARLAKQIEQRVKLESLPDKLLQKIDALNVTQGGATSSGAYSEPCAAYFRIIDQHDEPLEPSSFRIVCRGQNVLLQSFEDGYHLFTYDHRRNSNHTSCQLSLTKKGLRSKVIEFSGELNGVADAGVFRIKRLGDEDLRTVVAKVVDSQGKPLEGVSVLFIQKDGNFRSDAAKAKTNELGIAETRLFPGSFNCYATRAGYLRVNRSINVEPDAQKPNTFEIKLREMIQGVCKVEWRAKKVPSPNNPRVQDETVTTGEFELRSGARGNNSGLQNSAISWVRLLQENGQLKLVFHENSLYGRATPSVVPWVGRADNSEGPAVDFEAVDLANLEEWKKKTKLLPSGSPSQLGTPSRIQSFKAGVEKGALYVGHLTTRDRRYGGMQLVSFKILVTEKGAPDDSQ